MRIRGGSGSNWSLPPLVSSGGVLLGQIIKFVLYVIESLVQLITLIPQTIVSMTSSIQLLPPEITGICLAALTILIIFLIVGRGK